MAQVEAVEERTSKTLGTELNRIVDRKTKASVRKMLNQPLNENDDNEIDEDDDLGEGYDDSFDSVDFVPSPRLNKGIETFSGKDAEKIAKEKELIKAHNDFDIFVDVGNAMAEGDDGIAIKYDISLGGTILGTEVHPFSWEEVQKKYCATYGSGRYNVKAKNPINGRVIKHQPRQLMTELKKDTQPMISHQQSINPTEISKIQMDTLTLAEKQRQADAEKFEQQRLELKLQNERLEQRLENERKERKMEADSSLDKLITVLTATKPEPAKAPDMSWVKDLVTVVLPKILTPPQPIQDTTDKNFEMMMKFQEMNNKQFESLAKSMEKSNERMMQMIEKIAEKAESPKKEAGLGDFMQQYTLLKSIEDSGFEKFKMMQEFSKEKAEELAEEREERSGGKSDSLLDKLLTIAAPMIASGLAPKAVGIPGGQPVAPAVRPAITHAPAVVQNPGTQMGTSSQGGVQRTTPRHADASQPARPGVHQTQTRVVRTSQSQAKAETPETDSARGQTGNRHGATSARTVSSVSDLLESAPIIPMEGTDEVLTNVQDEVHAQTLNGNLTVFNPEISPEKDAANFQAIITTIAPLIMTSITNPEATIEGTATECINSLINERVNLATVLRDFDDEGLGHIMTHVPEDYHQNLKDLRDEIFHQIKTNYAGRI